MDNDAAVIVFVNLYGNRMLCLLLHCFCLPLLELYSGFYANVGTLRLERGLKERIPEIQEVIQSLPEGPPLVPDQIEIVLDGVRPFLQIVGGSIDLDRIEGLDSIQPSIILQMSGSSASLNSVKLEIAQRLQRHFMMSGLQIHWKEE